MFGAIVPRWARGRPEPSSEAKYGLLADDDSSETELNVSPPRRVFVSMLYQAFRAVMFGTFLLAIYEVLCFFNEGPPSFVPKFPQNKVVVFEEDMAFGGEPSPLTDAAWDSLMPSGRGFVLIENAERYGLKQGIPTDVGPYRYAISMYHQLHCVALIRNSYYAALKGEEPVSYAEAKLHGKQKHVAHDQHIGHCFDYLRQAIMCAGDTSIEWAEEPSPGHFKASVDGWGIPHVCRDWEAIVDWTLENKAPHNYTGIA